MAKAVKDATYYQNRLSDLSKSQQKQYDSLRHLVQSRRILTMSLSELCSALSLEYDKDSFEKNSKKEYAAISKLLSEFSLKLVPGFIPCNLGFNDTIYVTIKPNMQHDEDYAYVTDLIAKKRAPLPKDMAHISRMNLKLTNYNIMLRVFESLGVIGKEHLCTQQRMTLNAIISNLELPHEGAEYLRSCYTYAGEQCNYICDFSDPEYSFKPLKNEQQQTVIKYLALIAAQATYKPRFLNEYPYIERLNEEFSALEQEHNLGIHKYPAFNTLPKNDVLIQAEETKAQASKGLKNKLSSIYINLKRLGSSKPDEEELKIKREALKESLTKNLSLPEWLNKVLNEHIDNANASFFKTIPDFNQIFFQEARDLVNPCREAGFLYWTENSQYAISYPWLAIGEVTSQRLLEDEELEELRDFLQKPSLEDINQELRLEHSMFFGLIIQNAIEGVGHRRSELLLKMLDAELKKYQYTLLFIKTFYYVLFGINLKNPSLPKDSVCLGLCCFPNLLNLLIYKIYDFYKEDLSKCHSRLLPYIKLYAIRSILTNFHLQSVWLQRPLALDLILKLSFNLADRLGKQPADFIECSPDFEEKTLADFAQANQYIRPYKTLFEQIFAKNILSPLISSAEIKLHAPYFFSCNRTFAQKFYELLEPFSVHFDYLLSIKPEDNHLLVNLMLNQVSDLAKETLKAKLLNVNFSSDEDLCRLLSLRWSPELCRSLKHELLKLGLVSLPSDELLPEKLSKHFSHHKFASITPAFGILTAKFIEKLKSAQFTYLLFYYAIGKVTFIAELANFFSKDKNERSFIQEFLSQLSINISKSKSFLPEQLKEVYITDRSLDYYKNTRECVRFIGRKVIFKYNFNPLLLNKIKDLFAFLHLQERDLIARHKTVPEFNKNEPIFSNLDSNLIKSKLKESAQLQDVIAKIKDENSTDDKFSAKESLENVNKMENAEACPSASYAHKDTQNNKQEAKAETKVPLPSDAVYKLLHAIYTENTEIMDLNEFQGLCLSLKFMSMNVAVEEVNDWSYENFDEPLFDLAPEENQVYITVSLLSEIFS